MINLLLWLLIGVLTGWLAGYGMHDRAGMPGNIVIGMVGALIGGSLVDYSTLSQNAVNPITLLVAYFSAIALLIMVKLVRTSSVRFH